MSFDKSLVSQSKTLTSAPSRSPIKQYIKTIMLIVLTRMQNSKTDKFVHLLTRFVLFIMSANKEGLGPDYVIEMFESIQPGWVLRQLTLVLHAHILFSFDQFMGPNSKQFRATSCTKNALQGTKDDGGRHDAAALPE